MGGNIDVFCGEDTIFIISILLCLLSIVDLIYYSNEEVHGMKLGNVLILAGCIKAVTFLLSSVLIQLERVKGLLTSGVLWIFWFLLAFAEAVPFYSIITNKIYDKDVVHFVLFTLHYGSLMGQLIIHSFAEKRVKKGTEKQSQCPETESSFLSRLIFWWINPALIAFVENKANEYKWKGFVYAGSFFFVGAVQTVFYQQSVHISTTCGMRIKSALISAIYKKALVLSNEVLKETTAGEIMNLISVDCERIQVITSDLHKLWSSPMLMILAMGLLYNTLGSSVFSGLGVLLLLIPLNGISAIKQKQFQARQMAFKDSRIKLMNEILYGIKALKLHSWESFFHKKVLDTRNQELINLRNSAYVNAFSLFFWTAAPYLAMLATFVTYIFASESNHLTAQKAFVSLSYFNMLSTPISGLPKLIAALIQAQISVKRTEKFLLSNELDSQSVISVHDAEYAISVDDGSFRWDKKSDHYLEKIQTKIPKGKLVALVGHVGSGKSSFISALLGDMERLTGQVRINGSIAYVPQQAWIQNATLRDNILFNKTMDKTKYRLVLDACTLTPDIAMLPARDKTEVGERGINMSGGQRQRVSLARAVYNNADIYLLDDPLSAVDTIVGNRIFNEVIGNSGLLGHKTRLFVTHDVHWLPLVDIIIVFSKGKVTQIGSYEDLLVNGGEFAHFLKSYLTDEDDEVGDTEIKEKKKKFLEQVISLIPVAPDHVGYSHIQRRGARRTSMALTAKENRTLARTISTIDTQSQGRERNFSLPVYEDKLIEEEGTETGEVKYTVYFQYFGAMGKFSTALALFLFIIYNVSLVGTNIWLRFWTDDTYLEQHLNTSHTQEYQERNNMYLGIYGALGVAQDSSTGGLVGLSISYALQFTTALNYMVRRAGELETNIVSVERIKEYTQLDCESEENPNSYLLPKGWPAKGEIKFENYSTRYREGLSQVLNGLSCIITGGEKVGIVGRSGAGKSSIALALFRLIEASEGSIYIDGYKISDMALHALRSRLTILPQDPYVFSDTLRVNIDPHNNCTDEQVWNVLEQAHLKSFVLELPGGLNHECKEGGQNFSLGQRQLICLARALLHKTNIFILDEATAAVDMETDNHIQRTIREEFKECTVLTIAHRLNTIMDYDRIMVLDEGQIREFDSPANLLKHKCSIFYGMAKEANLVS